ncbi:hypothetical protein D3C72_2588000 [compost metagenome]
MGMFKEVEIELEDLALSALHGDFSFEKDEDSLELPGFKDEALREHQASSYDYFIPLF